MPIAQINMLEGRSDEQKQEMITKVTDAISESLGAPRENVRIMITEYPNTQWGIGGKTAKELGR